MATKQLLVNRSRNLNDVGLLIFRVMLGATHFIHHGWEKLSGFSRMAQHFPNPLHIGVYPSLAYATFADGICTLLVIVGLATRAASVCIMVNLAVVFFLVDHVRSGDEQLVFVYLAGYLLLFLAGPGKLSLDGKISGVGRSNSPQDSNPVP